MGRLGHERKPQAMAGNLGVHAVAALVAGQRRRRPDLPYGLPYLAAAKIGQMREDSA